MSVLSASLVVAAVRSDGYHATNVDLTDGVVWVFNDAPNRNFVARINTQTAEAESGFSTGGSTRIVQEDQVVFGAAAGSFYRFIPATGEGTKAEKWPSDAVVALGGGVATMVAVDAGTVYVMPALELTGWTEDVEPTLEVEPGSKVAASPDGVSVVVEPNGAFHVLRLDDKGEAIVAEPGDFGVPVADDASVTIVGERPVLLDRDGLVLDHGRRVPLADIGESPAVQQPSGRSSSVLVASSLGLVQVDFDGGKVTPLQAGQYGRAAQPVRSGSCVAAAWGEPGTFSSLCPGRAANSKPIPDYPTGAPLSFAANGSALVLSAGGDDQWAVRNGDLIPITNWDQADPALKQDPDQQDQTPTESEDEAERVCDAATPTPPTLKTGAVLTFGAQPGNTIVINVIDFFDDANCDPLAVTSVTTSADVEGRQPVAAPVDFGKAVQVTAPLDVGDLTVDFVVSDGTVDHDLPGSLTVTIAEGSDRPPRLRDGVTQPRTTVQQSKSVSYDILRDWVDDDGDQLLLSSASAPAGAGRVSFGVDGMITYTAETTTGVKSIAVEVQDEAGHKQQGSLEIVVQPPGTPIPPIARDDYAIGRVNQTVAVKPLSNDTDANGDLESAGVLRDNLPPELQVAGPDADGVVSLTASASGTFVIPYVAYDGSGKQSSASIRFDVVADDVENRPPVAVRDAVVVRTGRTANVDVLANDTDPDGDVMAVIDATLDDASVADGAVRVLVVERRFVRVEISAPPSKPSFTVSYTITDGLHDSVRGSLKVTVPAELGNQPPIVQRDEARVRVGQVVSVNVLANDRDPDGDQLFIRPGSVRLAQASSEGIVWLDGTTVRYKAGSTVPTSSVIVQYEVEDDPNLSGLQPVAGTVSIQVIDNNANVDENDAPVPKPGELRVFTGSTATFRVPLTGIDPDGDAALLESVSEQGQRGTVEVKGDSLVYTAGNEPGPDQFSYVVRDSLGKSGIGLVRVVVAEGTPHSPVPLNDRLRTRPGRLVTIDVLSNDSDPDGDEIQLKAVASTDIDDVAIEGDRVSVQVPSQPGTYIVTYQINDARSTALQQGVVTIVADPTAPPLAPITRDDPSEKSPVTVKEMTDAAGTKVKVTEIKVVGNDDDPDGTVAGLSVAIAAGQANDGAALAPLPAGTIRVVMTDAPQWIVYEATDEDGMTSSAVATIGADVNRTPECPAATEPVGEVSIPGGGPIEIVVADHVVDPDVGDTPQLQGILPTVSSGGGIVEGATGVYGSFTYQADDLETLDHVLIKVPVEDRRGDPDSRLVDCYFRVDVKRTNAPPVVKEASFEVEQLTPDPVSIGNLRDLGVVTDVDAGDSLTFTQDEPTSQNDVSLQISPEGDVTISAKQAPVGATLTFLYRVTDSQPTTAAPLPGSIVVRVVATTQPPPLVQSFDFPARQGEPVVQDVSNGAFDPFASSNPMTYSVDKAPSEGRGVVSASDDGRTVTFTPASDFFGKAVVRFSVTDAVGRATSGTLSYTVIGKPLQPGQPLVDEVSSHRVVLHWAPANPQGSPVTDYVVRWAGGERSAGSATAITIDGLPNGAALQFTVVAVNEAGTSEPSLPSGSVMPDAIPAKPAAPVITAFGDKTLTVTWTEPVVDGSAIVQYYLYGSLGGQPILLPPSARSTVVPNLTNGTPYTFTLIAENSAGKSDRSDPSNALSPATVPSQPAAPTVADAGNGIEQRLVVSWTRPADNGRPVVGYLLRDTIAGIDYDFSNNPATTQSIVVTDGQHSYTVVAVNAVGPSIASSASAPKVSPKKPAPVVLTGVVAGNLLATAQFADLSVAEMGNCSPAAVSYEYSLNNGPFVALAGTKQIGGLTNGQTYGVRVRAKNCLYAGDPSVSINVTPSGPPLASGIGISGVASGNSITWSWNAVNAANGSPITSVVLSGALNQGVGVTGTLGGSYGCGQVLSLTVTVTNANGTVSQTSGGVGTSACSMTVTTNAATCPEDDGVLPDHFSAGPPASCSSPGGFIAAGTNLQVDCRQDGWTALAVGRWLRIVGPIYAGWYVADFTVTQNTNALPVC